MTEIEKDYLDAIAVCKVWRNKYKLNKATPNQISIYNVFTEVSRILENQLACIQDAQGNYNPKRSKNE